MVFVDKACVLFLMALGLVVGASPRYLICKDQCHCGFYSDICSLSSQVLCMGYWLSVPSGHHWLSGEQATQVGAEDGDLAVRSGHQVSFFSLLGVFCKIKSSDFIQHLHL